MDANRGIGARAARRGPHRAVLVFASGRRSPTGAQLAELRSYTKDLTRSRDNLIVQLAAIENTIGLSVQNHFDLGEKANRATDILDVNPKEVKRLRGLSTKPIAAEAEPPVAAVDS